MNSYSIYFHGDYLLGEHIVEASSFDDALVKFLLEWGDADVTVIEIRDRSTNKRKKIDDIL